MKVKLVYTIEKVNIYNEKANGEFKQTHNIERRFFHEEIDMDEVCELLALKHKNEHYSVDEYVSVTCDID